MKTDKTTEPFKITYSAKEQEEIRKIRGKYVPNTGDDNNKMQLLRRLDQRVTNKGNMYGIIIGIIGCLIMGTGMSCVMVGGDELLVPGVIIGIVGIAVMAIAYPIYNYVIKKEREKITPEILRLTDELMK